MIFRIFVLITLFSMGVKAQILVSPLFQQGKELSLNEGSLKNKLVMFFKSECSACRAQAKDLSCLNEEQVIYLGFSSLVSELQKEARLMGLSKNVYYAPKEVVRSFGLKKDYSPVLFAFNGQGKSKSWLGKQNCKVFVRYLAGDSK